MLAHLTKKLASNLCLTGDFKGEELQEKMGKNKYLGFEIHITKYPGCLVVEADRTQHYT